MGMRVTVITELNGYRKLYRVWVQNKLSLTVIWGSYLLTKYDVSFIVVLKIKYISSLKWGSK